MFEWLHIPQPTYQLAFMTAAVDVMRMWNGALLVQEQLYALVVVLKFQLYSTVRKTAEITG